MRDREGKVPVSPDRTMEAQSSQDPVEEWLLLWTALRRLECRDRAEAAIREFTAGRAEAEPVQISFGEVLKRLDAFCVSRAGGKDAARPAPGQDEPGRSRIPIWMFEPANRERFLARSDYLFPNRADSEDAFHNYVLERKDTRYKDPRTIPSSLDMDLNNFDPLRIELLPYLLQRFAFYCRREIRRKGISIIAGRGRGVESDSYPAPSLEPLDSEGTPEEIMLRRETEMAIADCIEGLPARRRAVAEMLLLQDLPREDAAAMLHITLENLKMRLCRARQDLLQCLSSKGYSI